MTDLEAMLAAHVRFELQRWDADQAAATVEAELGELFDWVEAVPLADLVPRAAAIGWIEHYVSGPPLTQEAFDAFAGAVGEAHAAATADTTPMNEFLLPEDFERVARAVIGMKDAQQTIITQITTSEVYSQLIAHVLYTGLKEYLTNENVIARRVPGASSVMRLGQSAIGSAAPGLSKGIDRQLTAFVNANIAETMRESQDYLNAALDDEMMMAVAQEVYQSIADAPLSEAAGQVDPDTFAELVAIATDIWIQVRTTASFGRIAAQCAAELYDRLAGETMGDLLAIAGIERDVLFADLVAPLTAAVGRAHDDGFLESWIRNRLEPFYDEYAQQLQ